MLRLTVSPGPFYELVAILAWRWDTAWNEQPLRLRVKTLDAINAAFILATGAKVYDTLA